MENRIDLILNELQIRYNDRKNQQKISKNPKKQFYWLGRANELVEIISLIKRYFPKK